MAKKYYTFQLADFEHQVYNETTKKFEATDNLSEFTDPDIEAGSYEVAGRSGMTGTIEIIDWGSIGALEIELKFAGEPDNVEQLVTPGIQQHKIYWAEEYTDKAGQTGYNGYCIYFTGNLKAIPGGTGKKGENMERSYKYSVKTYKKTKNGTVLFDYDPANDVVKLGTHDFASELKKALYKGE